MILATIGIWMGVAFFTGTLRGRHRALSAAVLMSTGLWIGFVMFKEWTPEMHTIATMPDLSRLSQEGQLDIVVAALIGCGIILCYSFGGSKKG